VEGDGVSTTEVPGMAQAVETRRRERQLTPGEFAAAAGITAQGLAPVRKGQRRAYQDRVRIGVARALAWPEDWYDRLLAGQPVTDAPQSNGRTIDERLTALEERWSRIEAALDRLEMLGR
jgi:hypothetical protein